MDILTDKRLLTVIGLLSAAFFILFLATGFFTKFNLGNAVGMAVCSCITAVCIWHERFAEILAVMLRSRSGRIILTAAVTIAVICIICACVISVLMICAMNRLPSEPETVIVLGCRVKQEGPSLMLEKRINAAYEYLIENPSALCIASGGKGSDEPISEAQCIRDSLCRMGISADRIIMEDKSVNTFENIRNSLEIMDSLGMKRSAVIVTSEFHQLRAKIIASKQGLEAYSKSASTYLPLLPSYWIREWFGVMHEIIIGRK